MLVDLLRLVMVRAFRATLLRVALLRLAAGLVCFRPTWFGSRWSVPRELGVQAEGLLQLEGHLSHRGEAEPTVHSCRSAAGSVGPRR